MLTSANANSPRDRRFGACKYLTVSDAHTLSRITLFRGLSQDALARVAAVVIRRSVSAGTPLFHCGDAADGMYVILSGEVKIGVGQGEREIVYAHLKEGEAFGELALLDGQPRSADATAMASTELLLIPTDAFRRLLETTPAITRQLLSLLASRLSLTTERARQLATRNANELASHTWTRADRLADTVAGFVGSWGFVTFFGVATVVWTLLNATQFLFQPFDPFPFNLFNFALSLTVAFQAPFILMSQNRQAAKHALQNDVDFEVNLKNEIEMRRFDEKLEAMHAARLADIRGAGRRKQA